MKLLFIGFGKMNREIHFPILSRIYNEIHYYDPYVNASEAKRVDKIIDHYDLCVIGSLNSMHYDGFLSVYDLCNNFLIEKPVVINSNHLKELLNSKKNIYTGHVLRGLWPFNWLKKNKDYLFDNSDRVIVRSGNPYGWNRKIDINSEFWIENYGVVHDVGVHLIDIVINCLQVEVELIKELEIIKSDKLGQEVFFKCLINNKKFIFMFSNKNFFPTEILFEKDDNKIVVNSNNIYKVDNKICSKINNTEKNLNPSTLYQDIANNNTESIYILNDYYFGVTKILEKISNEL